MHKKETIGASILVLVVFCIILIPFVHTQTLSIPDDPYYNEMLAKDDLFKAALNDSEFKITDADKEKFWEMWEIMHTAIDQEVAQSLTNYPTHTDTVYLGTDKTFYDADAGDEGAYTWGIPAGIWDSEYYTASKKVHGNAYTILCAGGAGVWVWVGKQFYVSGSGSQSANIIYDGSYDGLTFTTAFPGLGIAGAKSQVKITLWDQTLNSKAEETVYIQECGTYCNVPVDEDFRESITHVMQAGHTYIVLVEFIGEAQAWGYAEASSDFGPFDFDNDACVLYNWIKIDF